MGLSHCSLELSPAVKAALSQLASSAQALLITKYLHSIIAGVAEDTPFEFEAPRPVLKDWATGCEHLQNISLHEAWMMLGLSMHRMPLMVTRIDPVCGHTAWTPEGKAWLNEKKDPLPPFLHDAPWDPYANGEGFNLLWHQVIAVIRMMEMAFDGKFARALLPN